MIEVEDKEILLQKYAEVSRQLKETSMELESAHHKLKEYVFMKEKLKKKK